MQNKYTPGDMPESENADKPKGLALLAGFVDSRNIAEMLESDELMKIGQRCVNEYENDLNSMESWLVGYRKGIELAKLTAEEKTFPWPRAANVKFPLIANAAIKFSARAYPEIVRGAEVVSCKVVGIDAEDQKHKRGKRVSTFMNWQLLNQMESWDEDMDKLLTMLPVCGQMLKKTYFDPVKGHPVSELIAGDAVIVNQQAKSWATARRLSHTFEMYENEIIERQRMGMFVDCKLRDDANESEAPDDSIITLIEQHRYLDLDDDGYEEPYIVTVAKESGKVLRILPRYSREGVIVGQDKDGNPRVVRIIAEDQFTPYGFMPAFDGQLHCIGFGHLLYPLNEAANTLINQLTDAGTLANLSGGFIGKDLRLKGGAMRFQPGEWKPVDASGDDLARNIVPIPSKEASPTLFSLLGMVIDAANELAAIKDVLSGEMPSANVPATTVLAMIEQGQKTFNAIYKRIWRSLSEELRKLFKLDGMYLDPREYLNVLDDPEANPQDFAMSDRDIVPVADPSISSTAQRMAMASAAMQITGRPGVNEAMLTNEYLKAIGHQKADQIAPYDKAALDQQQRAMSQDAQEAKQAAIMQALFDADMKRREVMVKEREVELKEKQLEYTEQKMLAEVQRIVAETIVSIMQVPPEAIAPAALAASEAAKLATEEREDDEREDDDNESDAGAVPAMEGAPGNGIYPPDIDGIPGQPTGAVEGLEPVQIPEQIAAGVAGIPGGDTGEGELLPGSDIAD